MSDAEKEMKEMNEEIDRLSLETPSSIQAPKKTKRAYTISEENRKKKSEQMHAVRAKRDENARLRKEEYKKMKEEEEQKAKVELAKKLEKAKKKVLKSTKKEIKPILEKEVLSSDSESSEEVFVYKKPQKRISKGRRQIQQLISDTEDTAEFESESEYEPAPHKPRTRGRPKKQYKSETSESEYEPRSPRKSVPRKAAATKAPSRYINPNLVHHNIF